MAADDEVCQFSRRRAGHLWRRPDGQQDHRLAGFRLAGCPARPAVVHPGGRIRPQTRCGHARQPCERGNRQRRGYRLASADSAARQDLRHRHEQLGASNERKISAPDHPAFFLKPASCLIGHKDAIEIRSYYGSVHPEPELAVVIGSKARDVDAADALEVIFGYTIFDDFTGNGMRAEDLFRYYALYSSDDDPNKLERREQHLSYAGRYKGT
ncbi:MAG: hypothetical protein GWN47_00880, partial [Woeseiaceae bacterium]|nr:hypothetical protein [Woeseiaceae bacterium]